MDEIDNGVGMMIVKFCILLIIGLVILSSLVSTNNIDGLNQVSLPFSGQPSDGDTLTFDDHVFEFDNNGGVVAGHISVTIGATVEATKANLRAAVSANTNYVVS